MKPVTTKEKLTDLADLIQGFSERRMPPIVFSEQLKSGAEMLFKLADQIDELYFRSDWAENHDDEE